MNIKKIKTALLLTVTFSAVSVASSVPVRHALAGAYLSPTTSADSDSDGVDDIVDNCTYVANPDQYDSNGDGIGSLCDGDITGPAGVEDCFVNFLDLDAMSLSFFTNPATPGWNPDLDFDNSGQIDFSDLNSMRGFFFAAPGPSAIACNAPPIVEVISPRFAGLTDATMYTFRGNVSDADGDTIQSIAFRNAAGTVIATTTPTNNSWSESIPLDTGPNQITIEATDERGAIGSATAGVRRDLFLNLTRSPIYDAITDKAYILSVSFNGSAPLAVIRVDLEAGTREILSGEGVGAGPDLVITDLMIRNPIDGNLVVLNSFAYAWTVDIQTGDRVQLVEMNPIGEIAGAVVDAANNRVLVTSRDYELWSISLSDNSLTMLGTIVVPSGGTSLSRGLAISSDGAFIYIDARPVFAEVNLQSLMVREIVLDDPPDVVIDFFLDENQNRIIHTNNHAIFSVDRSSGVALELIQVPDELGLLGDIGPGRSGNELLAITGVGLVAIDLTALTIDRLAGSYMGNGPGLQENTITYKSSDGIIYSSIFSNGENPGDDRRDLLRIDPRTGDRSRIPSDLGVPTEFAQTRGMEIDANGDVLWLLGGSANGLFRVDPETGIGEELIPLGPDFWNAEELCYDAGSNMAYSVRTLGVSEVIGLVLDAGNAFVLSSEALGIGSGPGVAILTGIACDPFNGHVLIGERDFRFSSVMTVDTTTGDRTILSDASNGSGIELVSPVIRTASPDGSALYLYNNNGLTRVDLASGDRTQVFPNPSAPTSLQVLGMTMIDNETAFFTDQGPRIWNVDLQTGELLLISSDR